MNIVFTYPGILSGLRYGLLLMLFLGCSQLVLAQNIGRPDSLRRGGPIRGGQRIQGPHGQGGSNPNAAQKPEQKGQVNFQASDSLVFTFKDNRVATLYGSSSVNHTSGKLTAGKISMNLDKHVVSAETKTPQDTLSQPVLTREDNRVRSNRIDFNYKTEKGRFEVARTNIKDGQIIGSEVKKTGPNVIFLKDAIYSTCQLDHPHYYIKADRMKVVDQEKVFFTNARLYILDIPYPLVFPFGYLPGKFDKHQSGLLEPTYAFQQKQTRGLGLQNLGWFQYFNDYLTGQASVDIFTSGTYFFNGQANYKIRDKLSGNVNIGYSHENSGLEPSDPGFSTNVQKKISISHNQDFSPYASLSASINYQTAEYLKRNSYDPRDRAKTRTNSHINYRYRDPGDLYNFNLSIQQSQDLFANTAELSGPDMNFSLKRLSPFASNQQSSGETKWYQTLSFKYQNSFNSEYSFDPIRRDSARINWLEALFDPTKYRKATGNNKQYKYGFRQQADVSMNKLIPSQFLNVSVGANYTEYWYPTTTRKSFNADSNRVESRQIRGFTTARDFSTNLSFSTTLYGLMNAHIGHFKSFRHTLRPSISFNYRPNFGSDFWGYYRTVQTDTARTNNGEIPTQQYSIFENQIYSGPSRGEQRSISFSLSNVFEAKKVRRDSTGEKKEKVVRLIDNLSLNSSYNFAADSLKLSDLNASLRAGLLPGMDIQANANFNFYERDDNGNKIDHYLLTTSGRLFELTRFSTSTSYSFKLGGNGLQVNDTPPYPAHYDPLNQSIFHPVDPHFNDRPVQELDSPLSFSVNFRYSWNKTALGHSTTATINANNINIRLTPKWSFRTQVGYDLARHKLTPSQFSLNRNLHCWNLSFTMNPFGNNQYYFFSLSVDASRIQSILQKLPGLNNLQRSSGNGRGAPRGFYR